MGQARELDVYLVAGVATTPGFFQDCKMELQQRLEEAGCNPNIRILLPYGDYTRSLFRQIREVRGDLSNRHNAWRIGGKMAAEQVRRLSRGHSVLFIGHSGGGAAAYQAARILLDEGAIKDCRVVQIGSPKVPIRPDLRERVCYFHAVDEAGRRNDAITRLGSWGGFRRSRLGLLYWDRSKYAPGYVGTIGIVGGHPHYFRNKVPYVHPDHMTNLNRTLNSIWEWIKDFTENPQFT